MAALNHIHTLTAASFPFTPPNAAVPTMAPKFKPADQLTSDQLTADRLRSISNDDFAIERETMRLLDKLHNKYPHLVSKNKANLASSTMALMTVLMVMEQLGREPRARPLSDKSDSEEDLSFLHTLRPLTTTSRPMKQVAVESRRRPMLASFYRHSNEKSPKYRRRRLSKPLRRRRRLRRRRLRRQKQQKEDCDEKGVRSNEAIAKAASPNEVYYRGLESNKEMTLKRIDFDQQPPLPPVSLNIPEVSNFYENYNYGFNKGVQRRSQIVEEQKKKDLPAFLGKTTERTVFGQRLKKNFKKEQRRLDHTNDFDIDNNKNLNYEENEIYEEQKTFDTGQDKTRLADMRSRTLKELRAVASTIRGLDEQIRSLKQDASDAQTRRKFERRRRLLNLVQLQSLAKLMENRELEAYFENDKKSHRRRRITKKRGKRRRSRVASVRALRAGLLRRMRRSPDLSTKTRQLSPLLDKLLSKHEAFLKGALSDDLSTQEEEVLDVSPTLSLDKVPEVVEVTKGVQIVKLKKVFPNDTPISADDVRPLSGVVAQNDVTPILVDFLEDELKLGSSYQATTPVSPYTLYTTPSTSSAFSEASSTPKPISHILDPFATNTETTSTTTTTTPLTTTTMTSSSSTTSETPTMFRVPLIGPLLQSLTSESASSSSSSSSTSVQTSTDSGLELVGVAVGGVALAAAALFMGIEMVVPAFLLASRRSEIAPSLSSNTRRQVSTRTRFGSNGAKRVSTKSAKMKSKKKTSAKKTKSNKRKRYKKGTKNGGNYDYRDNYFNTVGHHDYDESIGDLNADFNNNLNKDYIASLKNDFNKEYDNEIGKEGQNEYYGDSGSPGSVPEEVPEYVLQLEQRRQAQILRQQVINRNQRLNYAYMRNYAGRK